MRAKKKCNKYLNLVKRFAFILFIIILSLVVFFELTVKDRIELAITAQIKSVTHRIIHSTVAGYIANNGNLCDNVVEICTDTTQSVKSIKENAAVVNRLKTEISKNTLDNIDEEMRCHGIDVQLGNFTGLTILSDFGPYVNLDIDATTTIDCDVNTKFESAGVNQTLHHVTLVMSVDIYIGNPIRIESIKYTTNYELAQTVIVGNLPSNYGTISRY